MRKRKIRIGYLSIGQQCEDPQSEKTLLVTDKARLSESPMIPQLGMVEVQDAWGKKTAWPFNAKVIIYEES